jgi:hypothetical protein
VNLEKYKQLQTDGKSAIGVCIAAREDFFDQIKEIKLIREVFGLDLIQAKEVTVQASSYKSLDRFQETVILPMVKDFVRLLEIEERLGRKLEP